MSMLKTISEYKDLVVNGIKNGDKIIESIIVSSQVKNGTASDDEVAEIMMRKDLCKSCPFNSDNAEKERNYQSSLPYQHCTLCLCRIGGDNTKEYCLSCNCGMVDWNNRNPGKPQMNPKWTSFKK